MSSAPPPAVVVQRVSKVYGTTRALDRISLTVPAGQFVAVIGRSGAGKTTLLRCLSRAVVPSEGAIRFADRDVIGLRGRALRAHRARVGMIYQQFNLVRRLRVMDNVLIGRVSHLTGAGRWAALARWFAARERDIAARALDHVGLLDRAWQRVDTLSGGQQQRVAIARALAQAPEVILADEPVASLDLASGMSVMETLRLCAGAAGLTVIATLHHVDYARRFADVGEYGWQCVVTVCIALWGTALAVVLAVPLGLLGARNIAPHPLVYHAARRAMDVLRAVNEFVFALMFVTAVGLGPFAGMLALGVHTGGVLGKLLSETIEAIDPGQVEGVAATGAGRLHVIAFGVVPQVIPNFLSYVLLRFESDIRSASVIGMVGGGGIGFYLWDTIRSFNDREAATVILLIVAMVMCIDVVSARVRRATI